ncbi:HNH endonuclease [Burkholderia sp. B21-005]|uniref:HNH endonuclease n=1 Tax=Burkholderia sp. B21-005 TaxID=2890406 RepID=UPI001E4B90AF|nr:HNH endonuclease [Burkholderia sp. B21-005]UEP43181.1 HNH endonuclease [Burkholderia sp. B21-005]
MATIIASNGHEIIVDDDDFERLSAFSWRVNPRGYAVRYAIENGRKVEIKMHRSVLNIEKGNAQMVDHKNRIKIDNRKENLRLCTHAQNGWNMGKRKRNTTGYKGANRMPNGRFAAQITFCGEKHHLGCFATAEEAHEVYCLAADMLHGEFANHDNCAQEKAND